MAQDSNDAAADLLRAQVASLEAKLGQVQAELEVQQDREALFHNLVDLSPDAMLVQRADRRILYINQSGAEMLGAASPDEITGMEFTQFIHPDNQASAANDFHRVLSGEIVRAASPEENWLRLDQTSFYTDVFSTVIEWDGAPAVLIVAHNVTQRIVARQRVEAAEASRNEAHQRLTDAIDTISGGFALFDADDRLQICNQNYLDGISGVHGDYSRLGTTFGEMVDQSIKSGLWDNAEEPVEAIRAKIFDRHLNLPSQHDIRYPTGRWMRQSKRRTREGGVVAVYSDITDIKEHEQTLAEREQLYKQMLEVLPDAVIISADEKVVFVNAAAVSLYGADSEDQLIGIDIRKLVSSDYVEKRSERRQKVLTERCTLPPTEQQRLRLDGTIVDVETVSTFMLWQGQPAILGVLRNITERKEADAALAESERRLSAVTDNLPGALFQRVLTADGKLYFPYVSAGIEEVTGLTAEEITQDTQVFFERIRDDFKQEFLASIRQSADTLEPLNLEVPIINQHGAQRWINSKGRAHKDNDGSVVWDGIMIDITDQKLAEENAHQTYQCLNEAMGSMPSAFLLWDQADRLMLWNKHAENHHPEPEEIREGMTFDEFLSSMYDNILARQGKAVADDWHTNRRSRHKECSGETEFQSTNGSWFILSERRTPEGFTVTTLTDVTERHLSADRLREREQLHRDLLEALPDAVVISVDAKVVFVNAAALRLFGASDSKQLVGNNVHDMAPPELGSLQRERRRKVLTERCILPPHDQQRVRLDGSLVDVETVAGFMLWEGNPAYLAVIRDMSERKQIDADLAEAERRFSAVTDNIPGAVYQRVMTPDGQISFSYISGGIREISGVSAEEFMNNSSRFLDRIRADFKDEYIARNKQSAETLEPLDIEIPGYTPDGRPRWLQSKGRPHKRADGAIVWDGIVQDITEHKLAEERAERAHRWLLEAIGSMPSGFMLWDADDRLMLWNDLAREYYPHPEMYREGLPFEEVITAVYSDIRNQLGEAAADEWLTERRKQREQVSADYEFQGAAGRWFVVSERRTAEGFTVTLLTDVTERHQAEIHLRESEERYKTLVNLSPDAVYVHRGGRMIVCNEALVTLLGAETADQLIGRESIEFIHPEFREAVRRIQKKSAKAGTRTVFERQKRLRVDGSSFWAEIAAGAIELGGERSGIVVMRDATEQMASEDALLRSKEEAELANRAKTEFLANISHELRTPLNAIIGFSDLMQKEMLGPLGNDQYRDYLHDIYQSGTHLHDVINDILDLSKIEAGQLDLLEEPVNVGALVERCLRVVAARVEEKGLIVETHIAKGLPIISADERKVKQILINLLSNAVKFTEQGGRIAVAATGGDDGGILLKVSDTGIGMASEDIPLVLMPFRQVDNTLSRRHEGTGLGLPLTKSLAELHGGTLTLESQVGEGTVVTVCLPKNRPTAVPTAAE